MKFSNQALTCLVKTFQKALVEGVDISNILVEMDLKASVKTNQITVLNPEITNMVIPNFESLRKEQRERDAVTIGDEKPTREELALMQKDKDQ